MSDSDISSLLDEVRTTTDWSRLEELIDLTASKNLEAAAIPLLTRLGDVFIQSDADAENALCDTLTALHVMQCNGNLNFCIADNMTLSTVVRTWLNEHKRSIPYKYTPDGRLSGY